MGNAIKLFNGFTGEVLGEEIAVITGPQRLSYGKPDSSFVISSDAFYLPNTPVAGVAYTDLELNPASGRVYLTASKKEFKELLGDVTPYIGMTDRIELHQYAYKIPDGETGEMELGRPTLGFFVEELADMVDETPDVNWQDLIAVGVDGEPFNMPGRTLGMLVLADLQDTRKTVESLLYRVTELEGVTESLRAEVELLQAPQL